MTFAGPIWGQTLLGAGDIRKLVGSTRRLVLLGAGGRTTFAVSKKTDKTGAENVAGTLEAKGHGCRESEFITSLWAPICGGRRPRLARWRSTATMVVAVLSSMGRSGGGKANALITESQEGGVSGVLSRR